MQAYLMFTLQLYIQKVVENFYRQRKHSWIKNLEILELKRKIIISCDIKFVYVKRLKHILLLSQVLVDCVVWFFKGNPFSHIKMSTIGDEGIEYTDINMNM